MMHEWYKETMGEVELCRSSVNWEQKNGIICTTNNAVVRGGAEMVVRNCQFIMSRPKHFIHLSTNFSKKGNNFLPP